MSDSGHNTDGRPSQLIHELQHRIKVEEALEQVRARTIAMRNTEDLAQVVSQIYKEFENLDIGLLRCFIVIFEEKTYTSHWWMAHAESKMITQGIEIPFNQLRLFKAYAKGWDERKEKWQYHLKGKEKVTTDEFLFTKTGLKRLPTKVKDGMKEAESIVLTGSFHDYGGMIHGDIEGLSEQSHDLLNRFSQVFNYSYARFLDIKKAEAQAKEAKIEASMERVRSAAMAMHKSEELAKVNSVVFKELKHLGFDPTVCGIGIYDKETKDSIWWQAFEDLDQIPRNFNMPYLDGHWFREISQAWENQVPYTLFQMVGEVREEHTKLAFAHTEMKDLPEEVKTYLAVTDFQIHYISMMHGMLEVATDNDLAEEEIQLLQRFTKVIDLTYTRVADLQQAEAQAREAQIEAALERVRSRSMAMHHSSELMDVTNTLFEQMHNIGLKAVSSWISLINVEADGLEMWIRHEESEVAAQVVSGTDHPNFRADIDAWKRGETFIKLADDKADFIYAMKALFGYDVYDHPDKSHFHLLEVYHRFGWLGLGTWDEATTEEIEICNRFAIVFEQTYTRFLDLQKAEEQAREAQIEAALERVRSRAMAMHKTAELSDVVAKLYKEISTLEMSALGFDLILFKPDKDIIEYWSNPASLDSAKCYKVPRALHPFTERQWQEWEKEQARLVLVLKGQEKIEFDNAVFQETDFKEWPEEIKAEIIKQESVTFSHAFMKYGFLVAIDNKPLSEKEFDILERFAKVFDQTYTRFLDLQKAEAQAREAQIEAALERVRAVSLAIHHTNQLQDVVNAISDQLDKLGLELDGTLISIRKENIGTDLTSWVNTKLSKARYVSMSYYRGLLHTDLLNFVKNEKGLYVEKHPTPRVIKWYKHLFKKPEWKERSDKFKQNLLSSITNYVRSSWGTQHAVLTMLRLSGEDFTNEEHRILERFAKVFNQSYTRFLDIQKAEAQTKEAQIEAALETVRAASMAMHSSDGLPEVLSVMFNEFELFNSADEYRDIEIFIIDEHTGDAIAWTSDENFQNAVTSYPISFHITPGAKREYKKWKNTPLQQRKNLINNSFYEGKSWERVLSDFDKTEELQEIAMTFRKNGVTEWATHHAFFSHGMVALQQQTTLGEDDQVILQRFAQVFEQSYTRFLDLQKAEKRAREAQIEAALERVRAAGMAMHQSSDLIDATNILFEQVSALGIEAVSGFITIVDADDDSMTIYLRHEDLMGQPTKVYGSDHENFRKEIDSWVAGDNFVKIRNPKKDFIKSVKNIFGTKVRSRRDKDYFYLLQVYHKFGFLGLGMWDEAKEEHYEIYERCAQVFEQTYTRYIDIKKAEAQAREAQIEAALERVRARAMAMHNSNELAEAAELLYSEFYQLGVTPFACGYVINDNDKGEWKVWMTDSGQETFNNYWTLPFDADRHLASRYESWKNGASFHETVLEGDVNLEHHKVIAKYAPWKEATLDNLPPKLVLSCANFKHGHLLIIQDEELNPEIKQTLIRFAQVFEQTYTRFLDLKTAEEQADLIKQEKERLEKALSELKATQSQLIQSEKMASLGELTAGIAHEIQNPLNFVNNFSDVSGELIDEALEEIDTDPAEAKDILADLKTNLEKINHHGKRADSIVKGMLQHSRASSGKKMPTDINTLCDEYVRLAYHGLRAKDKSFNADYELILDDQIGKISIIPQDMSRVLLNIITNAFQACHEFSLETNDTTYAPKVTCTTMLSPSREMSGLSSRGEKAEAKKGGQITITISDNGPGIPDDIKEKIFQPFFTTKPTGQGTGLGLSLAYDIVKAHGGELSVVSPPAGQAGEDRTGSVFTIRL